MIWDFIKFGISVVTGRVHLYYIRSSLWCRIVRRRGGNKKWLRHGRLMQAKTRIQWPSRRINLRNNVQDRYLWLWRVTLLSMIWMWCLGPYFTTILCIPSTTCYSTEKPTFYYNKVLFHTSIFKWKQIWWDKVSKSQHQCILNVLHNFLQSLLSADVSHIQLTRFIEIQSDSSNFKTTTQ